MTTPKRIASTPSRAAFCALLLVGGSTAARAFVYGSTATAGDAIIRSGLQTVSPSRPLFCHHPTITTRLPTTSTRYRNFHSSSLSSYSAAATVLAMSSPTSNNLVTIEQAIEAHRRSSKDSSAGRYVFIDGSWHMPVGTSPRNARSEYKAGPRIAGALFYDIDGVAPAPGSPSNPKKLPHMKPSSKMFSRAMDRMGILPDDTLYVYGTVGCAFYHRAYWTFASCGYHDPSKVKLVQGSLDEWKECGGELEYGELSDDDPRLFRIDDTGDDVDTKYSCWKENGNNYSVVDMEQVLDIVNEKKEAATDTIIVDARSSGRFYGKDPEPRPGLRGGHMPGAVNVPFVSLLDPSDPTKFRPMNEVKELFVKAGIAPLEEGGGNGVARKVVCSCGSGVTAAALAVGLEVCGLRRKEDISIYDGSWIEWGGDEDVPIVTDD